MLKISKKLVKSVQAIACAVVAIVMAIIALFPMANLKLDPVDYETEAAFLELIDLAQAQALTEDPENATAINEKYDELREKVEEASQTVEGQDVIFGGESDDETFSVGEAYTVQKYDYSPSMIKILASIGDAAKVLKYTTHLIYLNDPTDNADLELGLKYTQELLEADYDVVTEESMDTAYFLMSALYSLIGGLTVNPTIATLLSSLWMFVMILLVMIIVPIVFLVTGIKVLITMLKNLRNPDEVYGSVCAKFISAATVLPVVFLLPLFYGSSTISGGVTTVTVLSLILVAINVAVSRLQKHSKDEFMYLNILQAASLLGLIGIFVFAANVGKADIGAFFGDEAMSQLYKAGKLKSNDDLASYGLKLGIVSLLVQVLFIGVYTYAVNMLARAACMDGEAKANTSAVGKMVRKEKKLPDAQIGMAICGLVTFILPLVAANMFGLEMSEELKSAIIGYGVGTIIVFLAEVGILVAKKILVKDITAESMEAVRCGGGSAVVDGWVFDYLTSNGSANAEAEAVVTEDAPAEEAAAEEAPAETEEKTE